MTNLTARQADLLSALDSEYRTGLELAIRLYDDRSQQAVVAVHQNARQLVRLGLIERKKQWKADRRGHVHALVCYRRTEAGEAAAK